MGRDRVAEDLRRHVRVRRAARMGEQRGVVGLPEVLLSRPRRSASRIAISVLWRPCSNGNPMPRSVARQRAATSSADRTCRPPWEAAADTTRDYPARQARPTARAASGAARATGSANRSSTCRPARSATSGRARPSRGPRGGRSAGPRPASVTAHRPDPDVGPVGGAGAVGARLDLLGGTEPRVDQRRALLGVLERPLALLGVVERDRAVAHQGVEAVEGAVPAREHVAAARCQEVVLKRPAGGDDHPLEVLLAPEVAGRGRRGAHLGEVQEAVVGRGQHPAVHVGVAGVEDEVGGVDPRVVVAAPVRLPGVARRPS